jgi:hypothetical protein
MRLGLRHGPMVAQDKTEIIQTLRQATVLREGNSQIPTGDMAGCQPAPRHRLYYVYRLTFADFQKKYIDWKAIRV